jgi:hypothetical protein
MYKHTKDLVYYEYAWKFLLYSTDENVMKVIKDYDFEDRYRVGVSDHPYSLMLGLVGDLVAKMDFVNIGSSKFPGYEFN